MGSSASPLTPKNQKPITTTTTHTPTITPNNNEHLSRSRRSFCCNTTATSSSSPSSSSSSHLSSPFTPTSPTPSTIPFSWEKHPGIPKSLPNKPKPTNPSLLPLPPPLRSNSGGFLSVPRKNRLSYDDSFIMDPFAIALRECSKEEEENHRWKKMAPPPPPGRRVSRTVSDRFGLGFRSLDLYSSCKTGTCSVVDSAVYVPRSGREIPAYGLLNRRVKY